MFCLLKKRKSFTKENNRFTREMICWVEEWHLIFCKRDFSLLENHFLGIYPWCFTEGHVWERCRNVFLPLTTALVIRWDECLARGLAHQHVISLTKIMYLGVEVRAWGRHLFRSPSQNTLLLPCHMSLNSPK